MAQMTNTIGVYTCVCEEDAGWVPQYLEEIERLDLDFVVYLDRCSAKTKLLFAEHPHCLDLVFQNDPDLEFNEQHKQKAFDRLVKAGYDWAMAWDIDETYEKDAPRKLKHIAGLDTDYVDVRWLNLWNDVHHIRIDGPFQSGHRVKFYNLKTFKWLFDHPTTNGAKACSADGKPLRYNPHKPTALASPRLVKYDLVTLHHGMMTRELRELHKTRWDRIYTHAVGANPYGFWNYALDEDNYPPTIERHTYHD